MEIQYRSHIKDRNGVIFIAIINPVPNISDVLNKFKMNIKKGAIICMSEEFIPYDRKADLCPVSSIL